MKLKRFIEMCFISKFFSFHAKHLLNVIVNLLFVFQVLHSRNTRHIPGLIKNLLPLVFLMHKSNRELFTKSHISECICFGSQTRFGEHIWYCVWVVLINI